MCCKSWRSLLPFSITFIVGVFAFNLLLKNENFYIAMCEQIYIQPKISQYEGTASSSGNSSSNRKSNCLACLRGRSEKNEDLNRSKSVDSSKIKKHLKIISKPRANFTDAARTNQTEGTITLRVTFNASGTIGNITPVNKLPDGLTEQTIEAARKIKFEPEKRNGKAITIIKLIQYTFTLY